MEEFTIKQFQEKFDELMDRLENGESFQINDGEKKVVAIPYEGYQEMDDLMRLYTDHEEGC